MPQVQGALCGGRSCRDGRTLTWKKVTGGWATAALECRAGLLEGSLRALQLTGAVWLPPAWTEHVAGLPAPCPAH